jgi:hypothetical protein
LRIAQFEHQPPKSGLVARQHQRRRKRMDFIASCKAIVARGDASVNLDCLCNQAWSAVLAGHRRSCRRVCTAPQHNFIHRAAKP